MKPAGRRDRRIRFEQGVEKIDEESGAITYDPWLYYFECWANREDLSGNELFRAQQLAAKVTTRYRINYPHGHPITPHESLRIVDQGRTYDVTYIAEMGKRGRAGLEIYAFARAEQGGR